MREYPSFFLCGYHFSKVVQRNDLTLVSSEFIFEAENTRALARKRMILRQAVFLVLTALLSSQGDAQTSQINAPSTAQPSVLAELTPTQKALVEGSRKAIVETGISDAYFASHYKLFRVIDSESDRRVMWEFHVNEHQTVVTDAIGYRTDGNQRIAIHSVANSLGKTFEIHRTLSRSAALKRLRSCIGTFENPSVQYGAIDGRAALVISAEAKRVDPSNTRVRERERERAREERERKKAAAASSDLLESEEGEKLVPLVLGSVNLMTGKCTRGAGKVSPFGP